MNKVIFAAVPAAVLIVLAGCSGQNSPADTKADTDLISANTAAWIAAYNAGDADKIVAMYADDAILMPPEAPATSTHAAMKQYLASDITAAKAAGVRLALDGETSGVSGDMAWHSGMFHALDANDATVATGKYLEIWHKADGKWLMTRDIWNTDAPPPAPAPAAAPAAKKK